MRAPRFDSIVKARVFYGYGSLSSVGGFLESCSFITFKGIFDQKQ